MAGRHAENPARGLTTQDRSYLQSQLASCESRWLQEYGLEPELDGDCRGMIVGWVSLAFRGSAGWPLAPQHESMRVMARWLEIPVDKIMKFELLRACRLERCQVATFRGYGFGHPRHSICDLTFDLAESLAESLGVEPTTTVCILPGKLAHLLSAGEWPYLAFNLSVRVASSAIAGLWQQCRDVAVSEVEAAIAERGDMQAEDLDTFQPSLFHNLAESLRGWSPLIVQRDGQEAQALLSTYIQWLDTCTANCSAESYAQHWWAANSSRGGYWNPEAAAHGRFAFQYMCNVLIFTFHVKGIDGNRNPLHLILQRAFRCAPVGLRSAIAELVSEYTVPSAATISRMRFFADVAWMLQMCIIHESMIKDGALLYGQCDSSPQGGRNWLMTEYACIMPGQLNEVADAVEVMYLLSSNDEV